MLPKITELELNVEEVTQPITRGKAFLFDYKKGDFIYKNGAPITVEGKEALKEWINKLIRTEKFKFKIYENMEYGISLENLLGSKLPRTFIKSELQRELTEGINKHEDVTGVSSWDFQTEGSRWTIYFRVHSVYGDIEMEVSA